MTKVSSQVVRMLTIDNKTSKEYLAISNRFLDKFLGRFIALKET